MKRFGLIGKSLTHSFSADFFSQKFARERLSDYRYDLFPLPNPEELRKLVSSFDDLAGLNVTIPFKKSIIPLLDELDDSAKEIGAVNTIRISRTGGTPHLKGFNTDNRGFEHSTNAFDEYQDALILGTGGAANAVAFVLKKRNVDFRLVSRNPKNEKEIRYDELDETIITKRRFIINATPLGMFPAVSGFPPIPYDLITENHFLYDLIYNPEETIFLKNGKDRGAQTQNGMKMLLLQAEQSWKIWNENN